MSKAPPNATQSQKAEIGLVPQSWEVAPLGDFTTRVTYGFTNPMPTETSGPYMVTAKDVNGGRINYSTARRTSWDAYHNDVTDKSRPRVGDVLLTKDGSIGRVALCDRPDVCINQSVALIQPNGRIDSLFLKYLLECEHYQHRMAGDSGGTTIKHIYITRVDKMQIAVPPLPTQRKIASILSAYDDLIENNTRRIAILEEMAQAIYREWFVNFRFPGHENVKLVQSTLGMIPEGWAAREIGDFCEICSSKRVFAKDYCHSGVPFYRGKEIIEKQKGATEISNTLFISEEKFAELCAKLGAPQPGDLLLTSVGTLGVPYVVRAGERFYFKDGNLTWFRNYTGINSSFLYCWLLSPAGKAELAKATIGSSQQAYTIVLLKSLQIAYPPIVSGPRTSTIIDLFHEIVGPLFDSAFTLAKKNHNLRMTRDLLLPKLISGKLDVEELDIDLVPTADELQETTA